MEDNKFEKFIIGGKKVPSIKIWKRGMLGINKSAMKLHNLNKYSYGILYYNKKNNKIAIKFITLDEYLDNDRDNRGSKKLYIKKEGNATLCMTAFLKYYELSTDNIASYKLRQDEDDKQFYILEEI